MMTAAERLLKLFTGNERSSGRFNPATERMHVEHTPLAAPDVQEHLDGREGVGSVPITDHNECRWGAIDIDNHDSDEDIDIAAVDKAIQEQGLPLIACRSKSGGVHAYLFLQESLPASKIKSILTEWAAKVGHPGSEVFPKQSRLVTGRDGKRSNGNWINMPYFDAEKTMRYAVHCGKKLSLNEFLDTAERSAITSTRLDYMIISELPDAPPCVQSMMTGGVPKGQRNEAMYNIIVYYKKFDKTTAEANSTKANHIVFTSPLPRAELIRTINSAMRPEYSYRCGEEVLKSRCNREECLKRKYGITVDEADKVAAMTELPKFSDLVKYVTEPVRWEMTVNGVRVYNISTAQLLDWRAMRELLVDRLTKVVPMIKNGEWENILKELMDGVRLIETPDDASVNGVIRDRLREFCTKADMANRGENTEDRKALLRGMPVVQKMDGDRCVMFRGQDFVNYLKRTKSEELKGVNLWFAVQDMGISHRKVRIGGTSESCNIWYLPVKTVVQDLAAEPVDFDPEI